MKKTNLSKHLEQARQLASLTENQPHFIQRNVEQIDQASRQLANKSSRTTTDSNLKNKAHILLAKKGIDAEKIERKLIEMDLKTTAEPVELLSETDLEDYIKHHHEFILLTAIEEAKKETETQFSRDYTMKLEADWAETKKELIEDLGQTRELWGGVGWAGNYADTGRGNMVTGTPARGQPGLLVPPTPVTPYNAKQFPPFSSHMTPTPSPGGPRTRVTMDRKMMEFAKVVSLLNEYRMNKRPFGIITKFLGVTASVEERDMSSTKQLVHCWDILKKIVHEDQVSNSGDFDREPLIEQEYLQSLRSDPEKVKRHFLKGARIFLEEQFYSYMTDELRNNAIIAKIGTDTQSSSTVARVEGYLRLLRHGNKSFSSGKQFPPEGSPDYLWMIIYYCFRVGDLDSALMVTEQSKFLDFFEILSSYRRQRDNDVTMDFELLQKIQTRYRKMEREETANPYELLLYNIIGLCDSKKSFTTLIPLWSTQDYMWHHINLVGQIGSVTAPLSTTTRQVQSLRELQERIYKKYGPKKFNPHGKDPLLYFQVLLLTLQFERAINYMFNLDQTFFVETVHFAMALYYYGILNLPSHSKSHTLFDETDPDKPTLNYVRLLRHYADAISATDPTCGLQYYYTIQDEDERHELIKDLVMETKQFSRFFGEILPDAVRRKTGMLDHFMPDGYRKKIVCMAAADCEQKGSYDDAIKLYDLAEEYDKMLSLLNKQLSRVLVLSSELPERKALVDLVRYASARCDKTMAWSRLKPQTQATFFQLYKLLTFFDFFNAGKFSDALEFNKQKLKLLPFSSSEINECLQNFQSLDDMVRRNFAPLLVSTMTCLYQQSELYKANPSSSGREQALSSLREQAKVLLTFVGMNTLYQMPGDMYSRLVTIELHMV